MTEQLSERNKVKPKQTFKREESLSYLELAGLVSIFLQAFIGEGPQIEIRRPSLFSRKIETAPSSFLGLSLSDSLVEMLIPPQKKTSQNSRSIC